MYVTVGSTEMFYTVTGAGPPCLVPSLAGTPIYEATFSPALADTFQLIYTELRANRTAAADADTLTLDGLLEEFDGVRQALGLGRTAVLGHSAHSLLALAYAARYAERVSHVIVVGGMPRLSPAFHKQREAYWDVVASPERKRLLAENEARLAHRGLEQLTPSERLVATYAAEGPTYFYDATYDCTPLWDRHAHFSDELYRRFWGPDGQFYAFDPAVGFPRISAPVFIAHGVFDFSAPPTVWSGLKGMLTNQTYHAFERSGHYPQLEERAQFSEALAAWLQRT